MRNNLTTLITFILFPLWVNAQSGAVFGAVDVYSDVEVTIRVADKQHKIAAGELEGINLYAKTNTLRIIPTDGKEGAYRRTITLERKGERAYLEINILERRQELYLDSKMAFVRGGTFQMGDQFGEGRSKEKPVHAVTLSDFYLSRTELTNREFAEFLSSQGNKEQGTTEWYEIGSDYADIVGSGRSFTPKTGKSDHPVVKASWYGAIAYCNWLSGQHGLKPVYRVSGTTITPDWNANGYRLPTEAEWEYAARSGGKEHRFGNGQNTIGPTEANFNASAIEKEYYSVAGEYRGKTVSVGSFAPNELGLVDMSGNVNEWCWDWFDKYYYAKSPASNPRGPYIGTYRVVRGGGCKTFPIGCRAANRNDRVPAARSDSVGFRLARSF